MPFPSPSDKQARWLWFCLTALAVGVVLALLGGLLWGIGQVLNVLAPVLLPLAIAGVLAYLLDPVVDFFEQRKIPRTRAILLVFFLGLMAVLILLMTVVPRLVVETQAFIDQAPAYSRQVVIKAQAWVQRSPFADKVLVPLPELEETNHLSGHATNLAPATLTNQTATATGTNGTPMAGFAPEMKGKLLASLGEFLPQMSVWVVEKLKVVVSWVGFVLGLLLVPVYLFYFLKEKDGIQSHWKNYLPVTNEKLKKEVVFIISSINDCLIVFFRGQVLVAMCSSVLLTTGFLTLGLNYAVLLGVMAGILGIVPYLGVAISLIPALVIAIVQYGDWLHPLGVLGIFAIVNLMEGLVISPKIIGDRVGLHTLTIIIAVMVGTTLMGGILGGVLAIPLTAALRAIMERYVWKKG